MKTLTALLHLLFPASRKNSHADHNNQTPGKRSGTATTAENKSMDLNDAKRYDASFSQAAVDSEQSAIHSPLELDGEQPSESQSKEELKKINDELALENAKPVYRNWRDRVNDDLAACVTVNREAAVVSRESITVVDDPVKNVFPTTTKNDKTRTDKNDAWLPFASFCFSDLCQSIGQLFCSRAELFKNQKSVLLVIPISKRQTRRPNYNDGTKL